MTKLDDSSKDDPLAVLASAVINDRLASLNADTTYTIRELFGDLWLDYGDGLRSVIGTKIRALVKQQRLPLFHAGKNSSNAHLYHVIKHKTGV
jgi:hypothetical protein